MKNKNKKKTGSAQNNSPDIETMVAKQHQIIAHALVLSEKLRDLVDECDVKIHEMPEGDPREGAIVGISVSTEYLSNALATWLTHATELEANLPESAQCMLRGQ